MKNWFVGAGFTEKMRSTVQEWAPYTLANPYSCHGGVQREERKLEADEENERGSGGNWVARWMGRRRAMRRWNRRMRMKMRRRRVMDQRRRVLRSRSVDVRLGQLWTRRMILRRRRRRALLAHARPQAKPKRRRLSLPRRPLPKSQLQLPRLRRLPLQQRKPRRHHLHVRRLRQRTEMRRRRLRRLRPERLQRRVKRSLTKLLIHQRQEPEVRRGLRQRIPLTTMNRHQRRKGVVG